MNALISKRLLVIYVCASLYVLACWNSSASLGASEKVKLSENYTKCGIVSVLADGQNHAHAVWAAPKGPDTPYYYYYFYSNNVSGVWSKPEIISGYLDVWLTTSYTGGNAVFALDSSNKAHFAFVASYGSSDDQIFYTSNVSGSWSIPIPVSANDWGVSDVTLNLDATGKAHIAWVAPDTAPGLFDYYELYYSSNILGSFSTPLKATEDDVGQTEPIIEVGTDRCVHISYLQGHGGIFYTYKRINDAGFSASVEVYTGNNKNDYHRMKVDSNGFVHLVWWHSEGFGGHIAYSDNVQGSFKSPVWVEKPVESYCYASLALDRNCKSHIVFTDLDNVYYVNDVQGSFSYPQQVSNDELRGASADIKIGTSGQVHIAWQGHSFVYDEDKKKYVCTNALYTTSIQDDSITSPQTVLTEQTPAEVNWTVSVDFDSNNETHVIWSTSGDEGSVWYTKATAVGPSGPSETWYLAEGCTNGGFESWVLVQNPNNNEANVSLTYMTPSGPVTGPSAKLPANSRKTFCISDAVPNQWEVSTKVTSDKPVIAERSVYWGNRKEGTDSIGVSQ